MSDTNESISKRLIDAAKKYAPAAVDVYSGKPLSSDPEATRQIVMRYTFEAFKQLAEEVEEEIIALTEQRDSAIEDLEIAQEETRGQINISKELIETHSSRESLWREMDRLYEDSWAVKCQHNTRIQELRAKLGLEGAE